MDKNNDIKDYLVGVRRALEAHGAAGDQIDDTIIGLREHIDEELSKESMSLDDILDSIDPPAAFLTVSEQGTGRQLRDIGLAGVLVGGACFVGGLLVIPNIAPEWSEKLAIPLIVLSMIVSFILGYLGRGSREGQAAMLLGASIAVFVLMTNLFGGGSG